MASPLYLGVEKNEIRGSRDIYGCPEFETVRSVKNEHAVLYKKPQPGHQPGWTRLPPFADEFLDLWDDNHVRMPFSIHNTLQNHGYERQRWDVIIGELSKVETNQISNVDQLADVIYEYNPKYRDEWKFKGLRALCSHLTDDEHRVLFESTLPAIARLAKLLPQLIMAPIPLLQQNRNASVSMTQEQISCLLANAFFCTFPWRNSSSGKAQAYKHYPNINFWRLFNAEGDDVLEKLKCILHYFRRVCLSSNAPPKGVVTFSRRYVRDERMPDWRKESALIGDVKLQVDPNMGIENQDGIIQLDFANKYLGGGVLGHGSVQEEIRFAACPELMASMLFVERMNDNEAVMVLGAERYNKYVGYSRSFTWMDNYYDGTPYDSSSRRKVAVLAIDAMPFKNKRRQYERANLERELNKAWVGFSFYTEGSHHNGFNYPGVATGNWGCGAFGGSPQLKSLIQLMACAVARRHMVYVTFGDMKFSQELFDMYMVLQRKRVTVSQLFEYFLDFTKYDREATDLYKYLYDKLGENYSYGTNKQRSHSRSTDKTQQTIPDLIRKELHSPDLFSQDDEQSEIASQRDTMQTKEPYQSSSKSKVTDSSDSKKVDYEHKMGTTLNKMANSQHKMVTIRKKKGSQQKIGKTENKTTGTTQFKTANTEKKTTYFYHKMTTTEKKITDSQGRIANTKASSATISPATVNKMAHQQKMATAENKMASQTSSLFDAMQRFDEDNCRLNLSVSHTSHATPRSDKRSNIVLIESDASTDEDEKETKTQLKKKLCKKITDYFSRKPV